MRAKMSILFVCLLAFAGTALAQTPDGMTPAEETVCDGFSGASFGLCNAYCEAMDCDSADPKASGRACERVLANFQKHAGEDAAPCGPCPCLDADAFPDFTGFVEGTLEFGNCSIDDRPDDGVFVVLVGDVDGVFDADAGVDPPDSFCGSLSDPDQLNVGIGEAAGRACADLLRVAAETALMEPCALLSPP